MTRRAPIATVATITTVRMLLILGKSSGRVIVQSNRKILLPFVPLLRIGAQSRPDGLVPVYIPSCPFSASRYWLRGSSNACRKQRWPAQGEVLIPVELFARAIARQRSVAASSQLRQRRMSMFTPRELDVLRLLARAMSTDEIGKQLGIAPHTVRWHVEHVIEKLQVHSKLQAIIPAARRGIIEL